MLWTNSINPKRLEKNGPTTGTLLSRRQSPKPYSSPKNDFLISPRFLTRKLSKLYRHSNSLDYISPKNLIWKNYMIESKTKCCSDIILLKTIASRLHHLTITQYLSNSIKNNLVTNQILIPNHTNLAPSTIHTCQKYDLTPLPQWRRQYNNMIQEYNFPLHHIPMAPFVDPKVVRVPGPHTSLIKPNSQTTSLSFPGNYMIFLLYHICTLSNPPSQS